MNRTELVEAVAARTGSDHAAARRHVDAVFDSIMETVAAGDRVLVTGFGTFDRVARPARTARNPRTGQPIEVPAGDAPRFRIGQTFRNRVARVPEPAAADIVEEDPVAKDKKDKKADAKKDDAKKAAKKAVKKAEAKVEAKKAEAKKKADKKPAKDKPKAKAKKKS